MSNLDTTFAQLRTIMLDAGAGQVVGCDEPGNLILHTHDADPKTGKPHWFGAVSLKKNYVAYHLIPLYTDPTLGATLSDALSKRRQGKSCFNFKTPDPALFAELAALTRKGNDAGKEKSGRRRTATPVKAKK